MAATSTRLTPQVAMSWAWDLPQYYQTQQLLLHLQGKHINSYYPTHKEDEDIYKIRKAKFTKAINNLHGFKQHVSVIFND